MGLTIQFDCVGCSKSCFDGNSISMLCSIGVIENGISESAQSIRGRSEHNSTTLASELHNHHSFCLS